ncbi:MAG TPA: hypothetical protein IGR64_07785 [Leptolyngbyaceae cyanobacterium M65_K2018_010]|nr:hypothetical protein [Leptolyngbyaceae cyanobacterium M65_K2018_010]
MVSIPSQTSSGWGAQIIARIVGFTCLFGFLADMVALTLPLGAGAAWRVGLLQQLGDRSIVLLFGLALIILSFWDSPQLRKPFAYISLATGVLFLLLCILVIRDSLALQSQAVDRISQEAQQLQTQVEQSKTNPEITANATPEDFAQALTAIESQADTLKQNAKTTLTKTSLAGTSNFVVMGIGLLSLGRVGLGGVGGMAPRVSGGSRKQRRVSS